MYYSHSTTLKHNWTHSLAYQPQIQEYWQEMARKNDLYRKCVFNTRVIAADWDVDKELWVVVTKDLKTGTESTTIAKILVSALGFLELPHYPNINGLNKFKGDMFHSAKWDYGISLKNKRVAVIGNGASACVLQDVYLSFCRLITPLPEHSLCPLFPRIHQQRSSNFAGLRIGYCGM